MSYQRPKWKSYTLPSVEPVPLILRDPPKSIHTRKKERVDMSNVTYMLRNDDTRINEGINYLQRGINPMVDVMYNNVGGGGGGRTLSLPTVQASLPYKIMKDGAFRPPLFTQEDILPLSRMRRPETSAITNPGIRDGFVIHNLMDMVDKEQIKDSINKEKINYISVRPTAVYRMELPQEVFTSYAINDNTLQMSASAGFRGHNRDDRLTEDPTKSIIDNPLQMSASAGFRGHNRDDRLTEDPTKSIIDNPLLITASSRFRGPNKDDRINENDPMQATKDSLKFSTTANANTLADILRDDTIDVNNFIKDNIILQNISPNFSILLYDPGTRNYSEVFASTKDRLNIAVQSSLNRPIDLTRDDGTPIKIKEYRWNIVNSAVGGNNLVLTVQNAPNLHLERNTPLYAMGTNISGNTKHERFHNNDPILANKPNTEANTSVSMNYGRDETSREKNYNINLRGMGSIGSTLEHFGSVPTIQNHQIPLLKNNKIVLTTGLDNRY